MCLLFYLKKFEPGPKYAITIPIIPMLSEENICFNSISPLFKLTRDIFNVKGDYEPEFKDTMQHTTDCQTNILYCITH